MYRKYLIFENVKESLSKLNEILQKKLNIEENLFTVFKFLKKKLGNCEEIFKKNYEKIK